MLAAAEADAQTTVASRPATAEPPRLVVNICIDQLRSDYLEAFMPLYCETGFKRLMAQGMVFQNASYDFTPVDRSSAIASLTTGTTPYYNGIPANEWLSRKTLRPQLCTTEQASLLTQRTNAPVPSNIVVSSIADELKIATQNGGKVYSIATDCDAAVIGGGHSADGALWIDAMTGNWTTSTYYGKALPDWMVQYNKRNAPSQKMRTMTWRAKSDAVQNYQYFLTPKPQKAFSYSFNGNTRYTDFLTSALINNEITELARQCVTSAQLGNDRLTDILQLHYYAGTFRHKPVSEVTAELQDTYVRLDETISNLVVAIEKQLGKQNVLFVLTSTGYFDEQPTDYQAYKVPAGTVFINRTSNLLNMYLGALYGQNRYVEGYKDNQIYLNHKLLEQKRLTLGQVLERSREMLLMSDGVRDVYTALSLSTATDPQLRLIRNGYNVDVCGDIILETAPGWKVLNEDNQQQKHWSQQGLLFPIVIYGHNVKPSVVTSPVTVGQIAPTITKTIRIRAPNACKNNSLY